MSTRRFRARVLNTLSACLLTWLSLQSAAAGPLNLSDTPLFLASGVKPNLIMAIDDSGSMDFELLLRANDGAAWWRTGNESGNCVASTGNSFTGCTADGTTDQVASGVLNFNNGGNSSGTWKKFAYLFPNGANSANNSDQRRLSDSTNDHYAIPPIPAFAWARSPDINPSYFNPATTYNPWTSEGGQSFTNATTSRTRWDAVYSTSNSTIDLTADFAGTTSTATSNACTDASMPANDDNYYFRVFTGMTLPQGACIYPNVGGSAQHWQVVQSGACKVGTTNGCSVAIGGTAKTYTLNSNSPVAFRYFPATFYLKTTTALPSGFGYKAVPLTGTAPDGTNLNGYEIKSANFNTAANYNTAIQNFANWFQFYRKRHQSLRAGLGAAFQDVKGTRVAGFTLNTTADPTTPDVTMQDIDDQSNRDSLYTQFYKTWTGQGGTPSRQALANLVRNFKRKDANAPIQAACQQNFGMLFTDGFANPPVSGDGFDAVGNVDNNYKAPYADSTSNTMADGIMDAYANALRSDMATGKVPIPATCGSANADPSLDCNKNLHMNFFAITLGTRGLQFNSDSPVNPYTAKPAIVWPTQTQLSQQRNPVAVDDLWHATLNGRGALLNAKSPSDVSDELKSVLSSIAARVGAAAAVAVNGGSISGDTRIFVPSFNTNGWSGDVTSYKVNPDGSFDSTESWQASANIPVPGSRRIFTVAGDGKTPMMFDATSIASDATRLAQIQQDTTTTATDKVAYLRGDHSKEQTNGGAFRNRATALGDIVDSAPAFVGDPPFLYRDNVESVPYSTFRKDEKGRPQAVYVGSNDGMLHAFDAASGEESFAFVPGGVFNNLYKLTQPTYTHHYYVDGTPAPIDAFYNGAWHTVLASGLGAGGQSIFALEVTNPSTYSTDNGKSPFLWEFTDAQDADLGYTFSRPLTIRLHNGKWGVVFGNGYNNTVADGSQSTSGDAVLFIVDAQTGALIKKIDTGVGTSADPSKQSRPNGLSSPVVVDYDSDTIVDYVYAGDLYGNLWKFNLSDASPDAWSSAYTTGSKKVPVPLFTAKNTASDTTKQLQPITTKPSVSRGPNGSGLIITFGTGKYLESSDTSVANLVTQTFYGIFDPNTNTASDEVSSRDQLTKQTIVYEGIQTYTAPSGATIKTPVRAVSNNTLGSSRGWYLDLVSPTSGFQGEMNVSDSVFSNGQVIFSTLIPNADPCSGGGTSWLMVLNVSTGGRLDTTPFDLNTDNSFNSSDYVTLSDGTKVPAAGLGLTSIESKPAIIGTNDTSSSQDGGGSDLIITNDSNGKPNATKKNPGPRVVGRQSWRQVR